MRSQTFKLLPGLRWSGKLTLLEIRDGKAIVDFDAIDNHAEIERHVLDRASLSAKFHDWTGVMLKALAQKE